MKKPEAKFENVSVDKLVKATWNYKGSDEIMLEKLVENIKRNGVVETLLVRELPTGALEITNGNHRYDAIVKLGIPEVMVCNVGKISEAKAKRMAVELNETAFPNDPMSLGALLREVTTEFGLEDSLSSLPYSEQELDKLMKIDNWPTGEQKSPKDDGDMITVRLVMDDSQFEAWNKWKIESGTDNDVLAVLRAIGDALKLRNQEK